MKSFRSFEEMNEHDINEMAAKTPLERLQHAIELTLRVYGVTREDLRKRERPRSLHFHE